MQWNTGTVVICSNIIFQAYKNNSQFPAAWLAWHIVDTFIKL